MWIFIKYILDCTYQPHIPNHSFTLCVLFLVVAYGIGLNRMNYALKLPSAARNLRIGLLFCGYFLSPIAIYTIEIFIHWYWETFQFDYHPEWRKEWEGKVSEKTPEPEPEPEPEPLSEEELQKKQWRKKLLRMAFIFLIYWINGHLG